MEKKATVLELTECVFDLGGEQGGEGCMQHDFGREEIIRVDEVEDGDGFEYAKLGRCEVGRGIDCC